MSRYFQISLLFILSLVFLASCSVYMASKKEGTTIEEATACRTKGCLLAKGAELVESKTLPDGQLVETYKISKATGSGARAAMHGLLDVATLGLWEVAGTPIEGSKKKKAYFAIKVTYKPDKETIDNIQLLH